MFGLMMGRQLTITAILDHALACHPRAEIVSAGADGTVQRQTYTEFGRRTRQLANALTRLGVGPGQRVATLAWNNGRHLEIYYTASCMGAVCHTLNPRLFVDQLIDIANHAEDQVVAFDLTFTGLVEQLAPHLPGVRHWVALCPPAELPAGGPPGLLCPGLLCPGLLCPGLLCPGLLCYEDLLAAEAPDYDWPELDERTACSLCYTSGTTGRPKGVLYDHRSQVLHAMAVSGGDWLALRARDAVLPVVPMFHACAWGLPYAGLMNGVKLVLPGPRLDGASLHRLMEAEEVTMAAGVPTVWLDLMRHLENGGGRLDSVERLMVGGAAAPQSLIRKFEEIYDVRVVHGWGMTELSPVGTLGAPKRHMAEWPGEMRYQLQSLQGRPLFGVEMRIVDGAGTVLPRDGKATGNLQVRGPWVAGGYFKDDSPDSFTADGWFETGDVGAIDDEGYLRLTDRTKDVIKSGGEWISSIALENIAIGHPAVREAACIAVPHATWGERPLLVVVAKDGAEIDTAGLLAWFDGKVAKWWIPDAVVVAEDLPHTATGKLLKTRLREIYRGDAAGR